MENTFNYISVPDNYVHCFNHHCLKSSDCMRHLVAKHSTSIHHVIRIINPACIPGNTETCPYFRPISEVRMAWGIKRLLDNIPHKDAKELKAQIIGHFGRTHYYRLYRKEYGLLPDEQDFIRRLFRNKGITDEPAFESYTDEYVWSEK